MSVHLPNNWYEKTFTILLPDSCNSYLLRTILAKKFKKYIEIKKIRSWAKIDLHDQQEYIDGLQISQVKGTLPNISPMKV